VCASDKSQGTTESRRLPVAWRITIGYDICYVPCYGYLLCTLLQYFAVCMESEYARRASTGPKNQNFVHMIRPFGTFFGVLPFQRAIVAGQQPTKVYNLMFFVPGCQAPTVVNPPTIIKCLLFMLFQVCHTICRPPDYHLLLMYYYNRRTTDTRVSEIQTGHI